MSEEVTSWRDLLGRLINNNPTERLRAAESLGVSPITLTRWVTGEYKPRIESLQKLPTVFPLYQNELTELIRKYLSPESVTAPLKEVPTEVTERILEALATSKGAFSFWSICNMLLLKAIEQLDPQASGMKILVMQCVIPKDGLSVRSLYERIGVASPPWEKGVARHLLFMGAESLAGYVVGKGEPAVIKAMGHEPGLLSHRQSAYAKSAAAYPLLRRGAIAGCLLVASTQEEYFTSVILSLIERYAHRFALAFDDNDFYRQSDIALHVLPMLSQQEQDSYTAQFRQRVIALRRAQAFRLSEVEAEIQVLQEIEAELLQDR